MTFVDAAIIYLALGSPVGMYRFFQFARPAIAVRLAHAILAALFWPYFVIRGAVTIARSESGDSVFETRKESDFRIIEQVEILKRNLAAKLAEYTKASKSAENELLETYIELSIAKYSSSDVLDTHREMLSIAGHPDADIGAICLTHRVSKLIERHQKSSALELVDSMIRFGLSRRTGILADLARIAKTLGDQATVELISRRAAEIAGTPSPLESVSSNGKSKDFAASITTHTR